MQTDKQASCAKVSECRQGNRHAMRSDHLACWPLCEERLSGKDSTHSLLRCSAEQKASISDQQFQPAGLDNHRAVSTPLADRAILQVDQTASQNQGILRHVRKCCEDSNLDCHLDIRLGGNRQKATQTGSKSLLDSTDFEHHHFRENTYFAGAYDNRCERTKY